MEQPTYRPRKKRGNIYNDCGTHHEIVITSRTHGEKRVLIDNEDVEKCKKYTWFIWKSGYGTFYCSTAWKYPEKKSLPIHRYVMDTPDGLVVDHINFNPLDNRKENLRNGTHGLNASNRNGALKNNKLGVRNVMLCKKTGKYLVYVKMMHHGSYETLDEAKSVAKKKRMELLGVDN